MWPPGRRNHPREIDKALFEELYELNFLHRGHNVLMRRPAGVGNSTLAQHLGQRALALGHTVRFSTLPAALADVLRQESLPATERRVKRYTRPDLLILDELGYVPCDARAADLLFHIIFPRLDALRDLEAELDARQRKQNELKALTG